MIVARELAYLESLRLPLSSPPLRERASAEAGVVVGCFGLPGLARLQCRLIRQMCGPVPILLADDGSERDAAFVEIEDTEPDVTFWPSDARKGHYAGDLSVYWKGLQWAHVRGFKWVCKLSQRFLWTRSDWLADAVAVLKGSGKAILGQRCVDNGTDLKLRTECVMFDVAKWLPHFKELDRDRLGNPTELYVWGMVHREFAAELAEWSPITVDRYQAIDGVIWHGTHSADYYRRAAQQLDVALDPEFTVKGWDKVPGWVRG